MFIDMLHGTKTPAVKDGMQAATLVCPIKNTPATSTASNIHITIYSNEVPDFVSTELARLYENPFSSLLKFSEMGKLESASTYVVRDEMQVTTIFVFLIENERLEVLNEVIKIDEEEISRFARHVFATIHSVNIITFRAIQTDFNNHDFLHQRFNYLEDIVIDLPTEVDIYDARLGKSMRRNLRRYLKLVQDEHPSFCYSVSSNDAVNPQIVRDIVAMSALRISGKNKVFGIDAEETERIIHMVAAHGMVGIITIDNRLCAGAISYRVGGEFFLLVLAHDSQYSKYSLGSLCCYLTICESIRRGGKVFHFLWGRYEYKFLFLGVLRNLDNLALYRSHAVLLRNAGSALKGWIASLKRQASLRLHNATHEDSWRSKLARKVLVYARSLRGIKSPLVDR